MRLVKLSVQRFQCIEAADVEFGPGLNVLFGPNDLGKSSLAWAIRAVLLLQHNSSHHERFVSWYGDGEPRVALTFTDGDNRYWRVTKTFGGSAGRSLLESSKDGRTFSTDANGRQVDEKLRKLLGWGLQPLGGTGGSRGFPESFLAHVLLSEQDSVRKVLFDTSLNEDADETGRQRLTEALGALAQDPLFKRLLNEAQEKVDVAFTATGRRKTSATSPFVAVGKRIKEMQQAREELAAKVRDTVAAEAKIRELIEQRDHLSRDLTEARATLAQHRDHVIASKRRQGLRQQIATHQASIDAAATLQKTIEVAQSEADALRHSCDTAATRLLELTTTVAGLVADRDAARAALDSLALENGDAERERADLETKLGGARDQLRDAERALERAIDARRSAQAAADSVAGAAASAGPLANVLRTAEIEHQAATAAEIEAARLLELAKERLREALSADRAQARELRRTELQNRRLTLAAEQATAQALLGKLTELKAASRRVLDAHASHRKLSTELTASRAAVASSERELATLDQHLASLQQLTTLGRLRVAEAELAARDARHARAEEERARARSLHEQASTLLGTVREGLPSAAHVAELRRLREEVRLAEARLGGGLSITIKPRRELVVTATVDGVAGSALRAREPVTLSAERLLAFSIDDLVDMEVAAGDEAARQQSRALRDRWAKQGEPALSDQGVATVEELEKLVIDAEAARRAAGDLRHQAEAAEQRALPHESAADPDGLDRRVTELAEALAGADRKTLDAEFDRRGQGWELSLQKDISSTSEKRRERGGGLEAARTQTVRLEARLESETQTMQPVQDELDRRTADLGGDPAQLELGATTSQERVGRELADVDAQLAGLSGAAKEDDVARADVQAAEKTHAAAVDLRTRKATDAQTARDALVQAEARLRSAQDQARGVDRDGVWATALMNGAPLPLDSWAELCDAATRRKEQQGKTCTALTSQLEELGKARAAAIQTARDHLKQREMLLAQTQINVTSATEANAKHLADLNARRLSIAEMKTQIAGAQLDLARTAIAQLQAELATIVCDDAIDDGAVDTQELHTSRLETRLRDVEEDLARARGGLEQVGGAIVREQQHELSQAIERETRREHEIEVEYDAWKLLVDTMRKTESTEGAHLGRALAGPVSERFRELTEGRYGDLELGAHLEAGGLQVAGDLRQISALSAGTQDQLATLLRLCVAEQIKSGIVLDDHLSQSDPKRVSWFNSNLRAAAHKIQIILITCRPSEVLTDAEVPGPADATRSTAADQLRAIDLSKVIRRFAASPDPRRTLAPRGDVLTTPTTTTETT